MTIIILILSAFAVYLLLAAAGMPEFLRVKKLFPHNRKDK